ncbi:MAG: hypothetical protein JO235_19065 [Chroococcidiopsidaceae cyanobacterium CP_BM_RX_35]|nr:hypothetical protein [Chroococcidiopsidaceae cyanobacterium CP_BM_RX_35]
MLASLKALLSSIVDYAGLFPPAKLSLKEALTNYAQYQTAPHNWMLGRFVLPASSLNQFEQLLPIDPLEDNKARQWFLSAILSEDLALEIKRVRSLNNSDKIAVTALEFPPLPPTEIERVLPYLPITVNSFFEIPLNKSLDTYLAALRHTSALAKIRTGGTTTNTFPSTTELCQGILALAPARVPFKATAGLHHPLPANYRLTSASDDPSTMMHGFLNVAVMAAFAYWQKVTPEDALELLDESSIDGFQFKADGLSWRDRRLSILEIEEARQRFFLSFGSCSFQELIDGLEELNLL